MSDKELAIERIYLIKSKIIEAEISKTDSDKPWLYESIIRKLEQYLSAELEKFVVVKQK